MALPSTRIARTLALDPENIDGRVAVTSLYMEQSREAEAPNDLAYLENDALMDPRGAYFRAVAARAGDRETELNALTVAVGVLDALDLDRIGVKSSCSA